MSENETKSQKTGQSKSSTDDAGEAQLQAQFDQEEAQGYRGVVADPTPNSAYTAAGVAAGEPTPETDAQAAKDAEAHRANVIDAPKRADGAKGA